jgi:hypothetical protein
MVTGNIYASNSLTTTNVFASGNVSAAYFVGDGGLLSNITSGGFTQPLANLVVSNTVTTTNLAVSGTAYVIGNTGIGTAAPDYLLDVAGYMRTVGIVDSSLNVGTAGQVLTETGSGLLWSSDGGALINIQSASITQPFANLVVSNSVTTTNVFASYFIGDGSQLSNIQVTQPLANLAVSNSVTTTNIFVTEMLQGPFITLSSTSTNLIVGLGAMSSANPSEGNDVAIGSDALKNDIGRGYNTAIGPNAMSYAHPTFGGDLAIGNGALLGDTGFGLNVAIGTGAMASARPSDGHDIAIGIEALKNDTGPGLNLAIGDRAMRNANPTSGSDVAIGYQSLYNDTGEGYNVAIGTSSMENLATGSYNTALGYNSAATMDGLSNTVSIGAFATPLASNVAVFPLEVNVGINTGLPRSTLEVSGNVYASNAVTTTNLVSTSLVVTGAMTSNVSNTTLFYDTLTIPYVNTLQLTAPSIISTGGISRFSNLIVSNLQVTNTLIITATNTQTTNSLSIVNQGTATALYVNQNEFPNMTYNVAEFWDHTQLAMVIDGYGNVAVHTASSPGYAFTVVDGAKIDKLTVTGSLIASGAALSSLNASNITTGILSSARIYGNTLSNIQSSNITQPFANLAVSNSVTAANITATRGMGVGTYAGSAAPTNSLIVSGNLGLGKNNPGYQLDMTGSAVIGGNMVIQTGGAMANPFEVRGSAAIGSYAGVYTAPSNGLIVSGNTGIGTNAPGYLLDVAGYMRSVAIVDSVSSIGSAGQVLTSTGSSLEWASGGGLVQPLANLVVSNTVTTSEIICNAFTTTTSTNWNYVSNAASARSTSVGWKGIRQVFGAGGTVYVYNNAVLETTLSYIAPGFGLFVAVGGLNDEIIVVSGVDSFYVYYFDGIIWNGPVVVDTTLDLGINITLWMPSLSAENPLTVTLVIGGYGWSSAPGVGNPGVGVYSIRTIDGSTSFAGEITPYNSVGSIYRNTVAISGDGTTIAIGQQDSSILYVYSIGDFIIPVFSDSSTGSGDEYFVSIDYYGQNVLLTINGSVRMYSISLRPV